MNAFEKLEKLANQPDPYLDLNLLLTQKEYKEIQGLIVLAREAMPIVESYRKLMDSLITAISEFEKHDALGKEVNK
jgi:hypothetical protein